MDGAPGPEDLDTTKQQLATVSVLIGLLQDIAKERREVLDKVIAADVAAGRGDSMSLFMVDADGNRHRIADLATTYHSPGVFVEDDEKLRDWVAENAPTRIVRIVDPEYVKHLLEHAVVARDGDGAVMAIVTPEGEPIPGLGYRAKGSAPKNTTFQWKDRKGAAEILTRQFREVIRQLDATPALKAPQADVVAGEVVSGD